MRRWSGRIMLLGLVGALAACATGGAVQREGAARGPAGSDAGLSGELVMFTAASLTDAFEEMAVAFTADHPDLRVLPSFAGSQTLAGQLREGARADVFASANPEQMDVVDDAALLAAAPVSFAANRMAIAVETGNPHGIAELADLRDPDLIVVLPADTVPAGRYATEMLAGAGVELTPASFEEDVRAALSKVALGEADAAVVYASDVRAATDRVHGVAVPTPPNVTATYPIATLAEAPNPEAARAFVDFVLGQRGQAILAAHGFEAP